LTLLNYFSRKSKVPSIYIGDGHGATQDLNEIVSLTNHLRGWYDITTKSTIDKVLGVDVIKQSNSDFILSYESYFPELAQQLGLNILILPKPLTPGHPKDNDNLTVVVNGNEFKIPNSNTTTPSN